MGSRITWRGDKELAAALYKKAQMSAVKNVVKKSGAQMSDLTKTFMQPTGGVYSKGYARGNNQKSTNVEIVDNGMTAKQTTNTDHIGFTEYGTRFMQAEPAIKPAFDRTKVIFKNDLNNLVK